MSRSLIHRINPRGRIAVLISACVLVTVGGMALIGSATSSAAVPASSTVSCKSTTLNGTYIEAATGWIKSASGQWTPTSTASFNTFYPNGNGSSVATANEDGTVVLNNSKFNFTYTINPDCTGTVSGTSSGDWNIYVKPDGSSFTQVETDPGTAFSLTETRVS